jgi:hypothetical protein
MKNTFFQRWVFACGLAEFGGIGLAGLIAGLTLYWIGEPESCLLGEVFRLRPNIHRTLSAS